MKKSIFVLALLAAVLSCNNNKSASNDKDTNIGAGTQTGQGTTAANPTDASSNPDYKKGLDLIAANDCFGCHKVAEPMTGPAYVDVAKHYAGKPGIEDSLANKIIHGGSGKWGQVMMTPHPNLSHDDAVAMVKYILLLK